MGVYWVYQKWLLHQIWKEPIPRHVALILDGNRRWAHSREMEPWLGHLYGADIVDKLLEWCLSLKIRTVTLYVLSTENLDRSAKELEELFKIIKGKVVSALNDKRIHQNKVRITVIGRTSLLPSELRSMLRELEEATKHYDQFFLNIAVAYGGRAEIVDAVKKISEGILRGEIAPPEIDEKTVESHLYTSVIPDHDPDMIVRTSGEERISNFLLWQSAYSELVFLDIYWPEFRFIDLLRSIRTFQHRQRRFGS